MTRFIMLLCWIGTAFAVPAAAQVRDSAVLTAGVELEQAADPPLQMTVVRQLDFGKVTIPNQFRKADSICQYSYAAEGGVFLAEIAEPTIAPTGTTASGCRYVTRGDVGVIAITCVARQPIRFLVTVRGSTIAGLTFTVGALAKIANADGSQADFFAAGAASANCFPSGAAPPSPVVTRHISLGGTLMVQRGNDLPTGRRIEVGRMVVEAQYP